MPVDNEKTSAASDGVTGTLQANPTRDTSPNSSQQTNEERVFAALKAQHQSDQRYRMLFDSIDDGFCILEKIPDAVGGVVDFRFIEANPAVALQSGVQIEIGNTIREILPNDAEDWLPTYVTVLATGKSIRFERELVSQQRILEVHAFRIDDELHQRVGVSFKDITERKRAEALLRSNHDTFFSLVQNAPFGLYIVDAQFRLSQVSTASQKVFENVRPLIGRDFAEVLRLIWPEPFASEAIGHFRQTLATGNSYSAPNTTERRNDIADIESYDWKIERITLPDGQHGVVCYFYDITERKKIEMALRESEAFNRSIIDSSPDCIKVIDLEGNLLSMLSGQALLGIEDIQPYLNKPWLDFWEAEHREAAERAVKSATEGASNFVGFFRPPRGEPKWWDVSISPILNTGSQPERLLAVSRDVTHRKQAEDALRESESRYRTLFNEMDEGFCIIELIFDGRQTPVDWRFLEVNPAFEKQTGIPDATGRRIREIAPNHENYWFEIFGRVCRDGEPIRFISEARELGGRWFDLYAFRMGDQGSRKVAVIFNNITERKRADQALRKSMRELRETETKLRLTQAALSREKAALADHVLQLQQMNEHLTLATREARTFADQVEKARIRMAHLAQHDALTDLPNRILLGDRVAQAISLAHRHGKPFALMFLDLDRFKEINDSLGHAVGDQLLQSVARRLTAAVRSSDTVCRLGGDEFIILLAEIEHAHDAELSAQNLLAALTATHRIDQFELRVTVSIGISLYPEHGQTMESLIKNADAAMYQAKAYGRNNYQFFEST